MGERRASQSFSLRGIASWAFHCLQTKKGPPLISSTESKERIASWSSLGRSHLLCTSFVECNNCSLNWQITDQNLCFYWAWLSFRGRSALPNSKYPSPAFWLQWGLLHDLKGIRSLVAIVKCKGSLPAQLTHPMLWARGVLPLCPTSRYASGLLLQPIAIFCRSRDTHSPLAT